MPQWLVVTQQQVADTASYRDVMMRVWYHSSAGVSDSSNSFNTSGDYPNNASGGSVNISIPFNGGSQLIHERTVRITKSYGSSTSVYAAAWLKGIEYWGVGQQIYANHTYTVPARPYVTPNAPIMQAPVRTHDRSITVRWERRATVAGRYQTQRVWRREESPGGLSTWAIVYSTSTNYTSIGNQSWTDTTVVANRSYIYRVEARNSTGSANSAQTVKIYTTPNPPTSVVASKLASGDIRVQIERGHRAANIQYVIQHSTDGGTTWSALATVADSGITTTYTHASPDLGVTHRYRAQAKVNSSGSVGNGLVSSWRTSGTVQLAAPPNAPTGLGPPGPMDAGLSRTLVWVHNPVDSSDQTAWQLRHRANGGAWTTVTSSELSLPGAGGLSAWTLPADTYSNGDTVEWEVRTKGAHPNYSPWSATASFTLSAPPNAGITAPLDGETLAESRVAVVWTYSQDQGSPQAQWRATLVDDSGDDEQVVEVRSGAGVTDFTEFSAAVLDDRDYIVRVEVASSVGLWSEPDAVHFHVSYALPAPVDITGLEWDRSTGFVTIMMEAQEWDGETAIEPVAVTVERSLDGGDSWEVVEQEVPLGGGTNAIVDTTPPTRAEVTYRAVAISVLPSVANGTPVPLVIDEAQYAYLSYGIGFTQVLVFYGNLALTSQASRAESLEHFAGRSRGVIVSGEVRTLDVGVKVTMLKSDGLATGYDFEAAAKHGGLMLYRDPSGRRIFGMATGLSTASTWEAVSTASFTISEADTA